MIGNADEAKANDDVYAWWSRLTLEKHIEIFENNSTQEQKEIYDYNHMKKVLEKQKVQRR